MLASRDAEAVEGVTFAAAVAATPVNVELLVGRGFVLDDELAPDDLVVAVEGADAAAVRLALDAIESALGATRVDEGSTGQAPPRSIRAAARRNPDANLAFVSVPGRFAANEVASAIDAGLNVFCFSDGVTLEAEVLLKRRASEKGLLLMGPDCGTAIIGGIGLGFANVVERGPVGIVGASGTGTQELTCLLDRAGIGISHAIGVGGRDMSAHVGGLMSLAALELLAADASTEVIVIVSKPPDPQVAERVRAAAEASGKKVVLCLLGDGSSDAPDVETAARVVAGHLGTELPTDVELTAPTGGEVLGLFTGGTLCEEVAEICHAAGVEGTFIDFGDDEMTAGRAHPMIDPTLRNETLAHDGSGDLGAVVIDVVLGHGAHPDPASGLAPIIQQVVSDGTRVVAIVCGTKNDPQGLDDQIRILQDAGAIVTRSAAAAGRLAAGVVSQ